MIVNLSWAELQACRHWGTPRHRELLSEARSRTQKGWHAVDMPAVAWRTLCDRLVQEAFHPSGRHRKSRNAAAGVPATRQAASKIERALAAMQMHPAMQNQAMSGVHGDVLIVWRTNYGPSLYPIPGVAPSFLVPFYAKVDGVGDVTLWKSEASPPVPIPFSDPSDHDLWS